MDRNADIGEIGKFDSLAERWWDDEGEFRALHKINPLRVEFVDRRSPVAGKSVLDVGCGGGILSEELARLGAKVTGIDAGEASLEVAKRHAAQSGLDIRYEQATAEEFAQEHSESFDIVTCMEVIEHLPDPASLVSACASLAKPEGDVYFTTLNRTLKSWLLGIVAAEYVLNLVPRGTHEYAKFVRPSELNRMCRTSGLRMRETVGLHYNPLTQQFRLAPGTDVNYFAHCTRP